MLAVVPPTPPPFRDREHAGRAVAQELTSLIGTPHLLVLGLPRGGVVIAQAVAECLGAACDVLVARKLGVPGVDEVAFGAIAEGSDDIAYDTVRAYLGIPDWMVQRVVARERGELARRVEAFRGHQPLPSLRGRNVVLVDDGMASGATMRAAMLAVRRHAPASITVAVPIASRASCEELAPLVDRIVALQIPETFTTVSDAYDEFTQVSDGEVRRLLGQPLQRQTLASAPVFDGQETRVVHIPVTAEGDCVVGDIGMTDTTTSPYGLVIFAHGGGSSRHSYRNAFLAAWLQQIGWATLRIDLLLADEAAQDAVDGALRFDVARITQRLTAAIDWAVAERVPGCQHIMLFGASTGAAAAMLAAAERPDTVRGVMSRGGRVDLASAAFDRIRVPVLMVVGMRDTETLRGNRTALRALRGTPTLRLVRGAGHAFDEAGALGGVGRHVEAWLRSQHPGRAERSWLSPIRRFWGATRSFVPSALRR